MFPGLLFLGYSDLYAFTRIRKSYKIHWDTKYSPRGNILSWKSLKIQVRIQLKHATKTGCFHSGLMHLHFHESVNESGDKMVRIRENLL